MGSQPQHQSARPAKERQHSHGFHKIVIQFFVLQLGVTVVVAQPDIRVDRLVSKLPHPTIIVLNVCCHVIDRPRVVVEAVNARNAEINSRIDILP